MTAPALNPSHIFDILDRHHVEYVVLGGYAAQLHGARRPTTDIDVAPATTEENLTRLAAALKELRAGIRVDDLPEGLPFNTSAESLLGQKMLNLRTPYGDMDLTFSPAAFPAGYDDLIGHAKPRIIDGITVQVAALDDVIRSKRAANRPKDLEALPELLQLEHKQRGATAPRRSAQQTPAAEPPPPTTGPSI